MTNEENSANQTSVASYATFAEGIACTYSRPGRLLRSWVRWMRSGCHQSQAVEIMREGLLSRPGSAETYGYGRLASTLRRIPIGFGVERYLQNVDLAITEARQQLEDYTSELRQEQRPRDFGIGALEALKLTLQPVIELTIQACQDPSQLLRAARTLMAEHARADSQLDRQARARLLDDIDMMLQLIEHDQLNSLHVEQWLEGLPTSSRMFAQSPQPGNLYVTSWDQCGLSGREHIFVLGLNDGLAPKPARMDPILLDGERGQLSTYLPTSSQRRQDQQAIFERINARWLQIANAQITLSYALRDFTDDSQLSPSMFLSAYDDQAEHAVAFLPVEADTLLDQEEVFWLRLLTAHDTGQRRKVVCERYGYLHQRDIAQTAQQEDAFTAYDGFVPRAGEDAVAQWNTTVFSPSRLEVLGTCPRKYFFQRCLGVRPPDQWDVDLDRWLSPLEIGSLLHALFEEFVGGLIDKKQLPTFSRDWPRLVSLLDRLLAEKAKQYPPPGVQTLADARDELLTTCEIFLKAEEAYTLQRQAKPMWLEVALGTEADPSNATASPLITERPVAITLGNGQVIQLVGRVDRIDALASKSPQYLVWDYKSGSSYAYAQDKPFDQGRQLQPLLYVRMLQARLQQLKMRGEVSGFGYFFPSAKSEGLRMEWNSAELMAGDSILCALLELLTSGTFIATDRKDDCTMCEFQRVCGPPENLVYLTNLKMDAAANAQLAAWRKLRGMAV